MNTNKLLIPALLSSSLLVAGCGTNNQAQNEEFGGNEFDQPHRSNQHVDEEISSKLGYVRYSKDEVDMDAEQNRNVLSIDRDQLADAISKMVLQYDDFDNVATLVTDDEVLVAYNKPDDLDREKAATMVRKTAMSVVPRFYHVYVSDKPVTFRDIQSLQNSNTMNDDYENALENIIDDMKESPQGENVYEETERYD
ncbi:YhcN/YlaJ family sporulation lipoprotein [Aquibacillus sediminis]|uniref:YhcN/YlaJ family sporulation lipoprotein n=1 Tax=Aquibacillus sediminis TaxID=2574734 RepID=UPI0014869371|nr:YhcN/YlaJ family sporulation lipoprotein [Aquibacillus sediminis]